MNKGLIASMLDGLLNTPAINAVKDALLPNRTHTYLRNRDQRSAAAQTAAKEAAQLKRDRKNAKRAKLKQST